MFSVSENLTHLQDKVLVSFGSAKDMRADFRLPPDVRKNRSRSFDVNLVLLFAQGLACK